MAGNYIKKFPTADYICKQTASTARTCIPFQSIVVSAFTCVIDVYQVAIFWLEKNSAKLLYNKKRQTRMSYIVLLLWCAKKMKNLLDEWTGKVRPEDEAKKARYNKIPRPQRKLLDDARSVPSQAATEDGVFQGNVTIIFDSPL